MVLLSKCIARTSVPVLVVLLGACAGSILGSAHTDAAAQGLEGTSWRLVRFEGGDDRVLTPDDRNKYTLAFDAGGNASMRFDCNRGRGTWKFTPPSGIEFGAIALTRAMCLPPSLHDELVKRWPHIRSYLRRDGHLFLSMMADGGVFEFEPMPASASGN